jgi:hypothetical protein
VPKGIRNWLSSRFVARVPAPPYAILRRQAHRHAQLLPPLHCPGRVCHCCFALDTGVISNATGSQGCPGGRFRAHSLTQHSRGNRVCWVDHLAPGCCVGLSGRRLHRSCCSVGSSSSTPELTRLDLSTPARSELNGLRWHVNLRVHIRAESTSVTASNNRWERSRGRVDGRAKGRFDD